MGDMSFLYFHRLHYRLVVGLSEIETLFNELFFGAVGGWLGFILVASIMLLIAVKVKYSGFLFVIVSIFLGFLVFQNVGANQNLLWCGIMYFLLPIFLVMLTIKKV